MIYFKNLSRVFDFCMLFDIAILIAHTSVLEMTQLSNVLITDNSTVKLGDKELFGNPNFFFNAKFSYPFEVN